MEKFPRALCFNKLVCMRTFGTEAGTERQMQTGTGRQREVDRHRERETNTHTHTTAYM